MTRPFDLIALGDPVLDLVLHSDRLPRWDDKHLGRSARWTSGGSEANALCAAARLGLRCALVGHAGQGPVAALHRSELARHGVALDGLRSDDGREGAVAVVYVSPSGERAISYVPAAVGPMVGPTRGGSAAADPPGAPAPRSSADAAGEPLPPPWAEAAGQARWLYTLPYDAAQLQALARVAQASDTRLAVDVERAVLDQPGLHQALRTAPDVLCFNAAGFCAFSGAAQVDAAALQRVLAQVRAEAVVVTVGAQGAVGLARQGRVVHQAAALGTVVDTTGAGDAFNGAWLAAWLQGQPMDQALTLAAEMAARCVAHAGPRGYLTQEVRDMLSTNRGSAPAPAPARAGAARRTPARPRMGRSAP